MTQSKTDKLNLFNFRKTEQQPAPAVTQDQVKPDATKAPARKHSPLSVYVSEEQKEIISQIAAATGVTKHAVLQYAIRKVCNEWKRGQWPEMEVKPKLK